jgi:hypothetical protein
MVNEMSKRLTEEIIKEKIYKIHGDSVIIDFLSYVSYDVKCKFIDKDYGEWWASLNMVMNKGTQHPLRAMETRKQTCIKNLGVEHPAQNKEVLEKMQKTCEEKYGVKNPTQNKEIREKQKQTCFERHGVFYPIQSDIIRKKYEQTCENKYGVNNPNKLESIKQKKEQIFLENYGCKCCLQNEGIKEKSRQTCQEKYGCDNPSQNKDVRKKFKQTCKERFGCEHPSQNREVRLKQIRSSNKHTLKYNWETGEEVDCTASYECAVVDTWNQDRERFGWQIPFENKEKGYVYFVDAYLIDRDTYVEIKGYFWDEQSQEKWEWFHKEHPNSELWDLPKLKELGIL